MQWTYSDHLFAILTYTILYRQCSPFLSSISAGLHARMNFAFLKFLCLYVKSSKSLQNLLFVHALSFLSP